jgi:hypothetical protein
MRQPCSDDARREIPIEETSWKAPDFEFVACKRWVADRGSLVLLDSESIARHCATSSASQTIAHELVPRRHWIASQRLRLAATVEAAVAAAWAHRYQDQGSGDQPDRPARHRRPIAHRSSRRGVHGRESDRGRSQPPPRRPRPRLYTTTILRGVEAATVYGRPFGAYGAFLNDGASPRKPRSGPRRRACRSSPRPTSSSRRRTPRATGCKPPPAGRDRAVRIVGYRRVLTGPGRTARSAPQHRRAPTGRGPSADPRALHCTVAPLWGTEPVASVGTRFASRKTPSSGRASSPSRLVVGRAARHARRT